MTQPGGLIDAAVNEAMDPTITPEVMAGLHARIAGYRYRMSTMVAELHKKYLNAEVQRKSLFAKAKLQKIAEGMTVGKATEEAEGMIHGARIDEVMAQAEYEALRMKWNAAGDVLTNLQMRMAQARDERNRPDHG